ncbi:peptidoglycan-binding domain-containing protein [Streptomyces sp. NPDC053755]|uniref:peptidoglycan-binding domain-containing protein n=1 Tax=Streptomyces sp. NPDC053755 TaxID=3155815 RepID=UPI00343CD855
MTGPAPTPAPFTAAPFTAGAPRAGAPSETMPLLLRGVVGDPDFTGSHPRELGEERPATRRRGALVALAAAVAVAVIGTAALAAGLLDGGQETDDRAAVPTVTTSPSENVAVSESPTPSPSASASATSSPSATPSASASPSARTASPSASPSGGPATSSSPAGPPSPSASRSPSAPAVAPTQTAEEPTLRPGDYGSEVKELQRRLRQVWAYDGRADGRYDDDVEEAVARYQSYKYIREDPPGVYGPHTRRALEAETDG